MSKILLCVKGKNLPLNKKLNSFPFLKVPSLFSINIDECSNLKLYKEKDGFCWYSGGDLTNEEIKPIELFLEQLRGQCDKSVVWAETTSTSLEKNWNFWKLSRGN
tara:strand:+ start:66768 stop:67082 length:315 start_codon:yes stop_codon:yes gene_type:complete